MIEHILKASLDGHKAVTIVYQGKNAITQRDIQVIDLTEENVKAICYLRHEPRIFKKDKILAADYIKIRS